MGAGAAKELVDASKGATDEDLKKACAELSKDERTKLMGALGNLTYPPNGVWEGLAAHEEWIKAGCGDGNYVVDDSPYGPMKFPDIDCLDKMPNLDGYNSYCAEEFRLKPSIYDAMKTRKTPMGVGLARCIKTGMDCKGHPNIKMCGLVAGDEESYKVFAEIFDPVIDKRHGGYAASAKHVTDMNPANLLTSKGVKIDPTGKYTLTTRCRTGRSVRGFKLPPAISFQERRDLEALCAKALLTLEGDLKGDYFPLQGSRSYKAKPTGMSKEEEELFRKSGNLFQEPDSPLLLSGGMGRHWPDGRGIFANNARNFFVWINEEDHLRIVSMEKGDNVDAIFRRFAAASEGVLKSVKAAGYDFMHNDHLGWVLTCPSNLGTGLRAGTIVKVPKLSARSDFKKLCGQLGLQARGTAGVDSVSTDGRFDISNADRIGKSETHLVNIFIDGVRRFILWEQALEKGQDVENEIKTAKPWAP
jgi:creatine kinase